MNQAPFRILIRWTDLIFHPSSKVEVAIRVTGFGSSTGSRTNLIQKRTHTHPLHIHQPFAILILTL